MHLVELFYDFDASLDAFPSAISLAKPMHLSLSARKSMALLKTPFPESPFSISFLTYSCSCSQIDFSSGALSALPALSNGSRNIARTRTCEQIFRFMWTTRTRKSLSFPQILAGFLPRESNCFLTLRDCCFLWRGKSQKIFPL